MLQRRPPAVPGTALALLLFAPGCGLIHPSAPDAESDATWNDGDGGFVPDARSEEEGDAQAAQDAGPSWDGEAENDAASDPSCASDDACGAEAYCSKVTQRCSARCDAQGACIGPTIAVSNNRIATDGTQVCYADDGALTGGPAYVVRGWDGASAAPRTLAEGDGLRVLLLADGYCYFAAPSLQRVSLSGGEPELVQALEAQPRRAWLTGDHVYWSAPRGAVLEVYRIARGGGAPAELITAGDPAKLWEAGNSSTLFRRFKPTFASCAIAMAPLSDLASETTIPMSFSKNCNGALWASEESLLFTQFEPVHYYPFRVDLADPSVENTVRLHSQELMMYQVRGSWVYAQSVVDGSTVVGVPNTVSYQRANLDGSPTERLFTPTPGTAVYAPVPFELDDNVHRTFAVLDGRLIYQHRREARLVAVPLSVSE